MLSVWSSYDPHKSIHGKSREDSTHLSQEADTAAQQKFGDAADSGQLDLLSMIPWPKTRSTTTTTTPLPCPGPRPTPRPMLDRLQSVLRADDCHFFRSCSSQPSTSSQTAPMSHSRTRSPAPIRVRAHRHPSRPADGPFRGRKPDIHSWHANRQVHGRETRHAVGQQRPTGHARTTRPCTVTGDKWRCQSGEVEPKTLDQR